MAIGTHDLDTVEGPFSYEALPPSEIEFKPLNQTKTYTAVELMDLYAVSHFFQLYIFRVLGFNSGLKFVCKEHPFQF